MQPVRNLSQLMGKQLACKYSQLRDQSKELKQQRAMSVSKANPEKQLIEDDFHESKKSMIA